MRAPSTQSSKRGVGDVRAMASSQGVFDDVLKERMSEGFDDWRVWKSSTIDEHE